jgi:hypothetical protein
MTQLTSLSLCGTLHAIGGSLRCERVLASAGCAWMVCVTGGVVALGAVAGGGSLRGASRGVAVRADNEFGDDGAASLAPSLLRMTQLTFLNLSCTLLESAAAGAVSGCWRTRLCMDDVECCGLGGCAGGAVAGCGACEGRAEGRRCVQAI